MIEMTTEAPPTLETMDELFEALSRLVGRTLMVHYPGQKGNDYVRAAPPFRSVGVLKWLKLQDGGVVIEVFLGRPLIEQYPQLPTVGLNTKISVLTDDVWTVVHQPRSGKEGNR